MSDVTRILSQIESGNSSAEELLLPLVYDELAKSRDSADGEQWLDYTATALVDKAYVRLVAVDEVQHWDSRGHFFAADGITLGPKLEKYIS